MLFDVYDSRVLHLKNHFVMAPLTRSRADPFNRPNALMAEYYGQRAGAGLIISEGTSPSPNGVGYPRIPGLYNDAQVEGWSRVTAAVHAQGGKIFVQLMHTGRVTHVANLPTGAEVVGPTNVICPGEMYTDVLGMQPFSKPRAMTESDINAAIQEYAQSAAMALRAGFDGVELHAANGYLIEQFLNPNVNQRTDGYGGSSASRNRFALEVTRAVAAKIGADRTGMRLSPYGVFNSTGPYDGLTAQYAELTQELSTMGLGYLHVLDHSAMGAPAVPPDIKVKLRQIFKGTFILAGGFDAVSAEAALHERRADLIAFGRPFLANPDLVERVRSSKPLNPPDMDTFYTPGAKGYTDYPTA